MSDKFILNPDHSVTPTDDLIAWAMWFETADRSVAKTTIAPGVRVSTVFLGLDHSFGDGPPLLFETMVFGGEQDGEMRRYSTWDEAIAGHESLVTDLQKETA